MKNSNQKNFLKSTVKLNLLLLIFAFLPCKTSFVQIELEDVFEKKTNVSLKLGINLPVTIGGTLNGIVFYSPIDNITIEAGIGGMFLPWNIDLLGYGSGNKPPLIDRTVTFGFFYTARLRINYLTKIIPIEDFSLYSVVGYKNWHFNSDKRYTVDKSKMTLGLLGFEKNLVGRINYYMDLGFFMCFDKMKRIDGIAPISNQEKIRGYFFDENQIEQKSRFLGLHLSIGINMSVL